MPLLLPSPCALSPQDSARVAVLQYLSACGDGYVSAREIASYLPLSGQQIAAALCELAAWDLLLLEDKSPRLPGVNLRAKLQRESWSRCDAKRAALYAFFVHSAPPGLTLQKQPRTKPGQLKHPGSELPAEFVAPQTPTVSSAFTATFNLRLLGGFGAFLLAAHSTAPLEHPSDSFAEIIDSRSAVLVLAKRDACWSSDDLRELVFLRSDGTCRSLSGRECAVSWDKEAVIYSDGTMLSYVHLGRAMFSVVLGELR